VDLVGGGAGVGAAGHSRRDLGRWEQAGYGLVWAGAVGNGIDRFVNGYVVDFFNLIWIRFPVFNVADVAINLGVACLLIGLLQDNSKKTGSTSTSPRLEKKPGRDSTHFKD
jgi:signal peptidase II (EC:3.4.23.36). Aspartic peptidase. MEROPS family A08